MRRALSTMAIGAAVLALAACGNADDKTAAAPPPPPSTAVSVESATPSPAASTNTTQVCDKVAAIYRNGFAGFSGQLGKMIANKEAKDTAGADAAEKAAGTELKKVGARLRQEVAAADDPDLKTAGETSAAKVTRSATDAKFFDSIRTNADLSKIEPKILDWMTPVTGFCA